MKKLSLILVTSCMLAATAIAQDLHKPCIAHELSNEQFATSPEAKRASEALEAYTQEFIKNRSQNKGTAVTDSPILVIPVVVHIVHDYGSENITDEQTYSAIQVLNRDFKKQNADTSSVLPYFKSRIGKMNIEFRLAQLDPQGNCTRGITRYISPTVTRDGRQYGQVADIIAWDSRKYLNIYIVRAIDGAGAFSFLPGSFPVGSKRAGVVCSYTQFGSKGASGGNFAERTIPHEVGHFLNLPHTWGRTNDPGVAANCSDDDGVDDTPNTIGVAAQNCPRAMKSCVGDPDSIANVENIMDYSNCARMFTTGQVLRMRAALRGSADRNTLWQPANLVATGTNDGYVVTKCVPKADFASSTQTTCINEAVQYTDFSWKDTVTSWTWTFEGGIADNENAQNPSVTYAAPGVYKVKLVVGNSAGTDALEKLSYITVYPLESTLKSPLGETFEVVNSLETKGWRVESEDNTTWVRTTTAAYTGTASYLIKNWNGNPSGQIDAFITPALNFVNADTVMVRFRLAHAVRNSSTADEFSIHVSRNCGASYLKQFSAKGAALSSVTGNRSSSFVPANQAEWKQYTIALPGAALRGSVLIKFQNKSDAGNNVYIDDIEIVSNDKTSGVSQIIRIDGLNVYPNPFEGTAKVNFNLLSDEKVYLAIYDLLGREVSVIADGRLGSGTHEFEINEQTAKLSQAGFYFIKLKAGNEIATEKVLLTK